MTNAANSQAAKRAALRADPMGDAAAEAALVFLTEYAAQAGQAKANATYMEHYRKIVLANLKKKAPPECKSDSSRDDWARAHPDYLKHLQAQRDAEAEDMKLFWKRVAAEATIEAWRTKNANTRGAGRMQ